MIDLHCHILPGLDDGAPDLSVSLEMAAAAVSMGIVTVVATPHLRADFPNVQVTELRDRCAELQVEIARERLPLTVLPGAEVSVTWALEADEAALKLASINQRGTDILIEAPQDSSVMTGPLIAAIQRRGYRVVLAHPERSRDFQDNQTYLRELAAHGLVLQVTAAGLIRKRRHDPMHSAAWAVAASRLPALVASDSHDSVGVRTVSGLADARQQLIGSVGKPLATWLTCTAPHAVLEGRRIPRAPERRLQVTGRRRYWS